MDKVFDRKQLIKITTLLLLLLVACKFTQGAAFAVMVPIAIFAITSGENEVLWFVLMLASFAVGVNGYFLPKGLVFVVSQKVLMLLVAGFMLVQIFGRRAPRSLTPFWGIFPYLIFIAITSQRGWAPIISNLKLLLFVMIFLAYFGSVVKVANARIDIVKLRGMFLVIVMYLVFGSFLVWPIGEIGYMNEQELLLNPDAKSMFKGTANHSQSLGVILSLTGTFLYADWMFLIRQKSKMYLALLVGSAILIYSSQCRTAMATFIFGLGFATYCAMKERGIGARWRSKVISTMMMIGAVMMIAIVTVPQLRGRAVDFILKYDKSGNAELTSEAVWGSRMGKLEGSLGNWRRSPIIGNGFQVSEDMSDRELNSIGNILSAPVEKSTWTYAILEEGGIIGMVLFCIFIVSASFLLMHSRSYMTLTMLLATLVSNLGEFTFFSMSGGGGIFWAMIFLATIFDCYRATQNAQMRFSGGYNVRSY